MRDLFEFAARAGASPAKVLITGETGVGKDVVASHIHHHSVRRRAEYVAVNCAGVTETLLESELFGHVKGSFTGAFRDKVGQLLLAHGGTLFLDEVGEMSLRMQALLLRFLENGEIQAVGGDAVRQVDVRVIAATNRDLSEMVRRGEFREDLLYRLQVIHLHVPPLRERRSDIRPLATHFIAMLNQPRTLTEDAWKAIERYRWPGNVRELRNIVEQVIHRSSSDRPVDVADLPPAISAVDAGLLPQRERRRQLAEDLYHALVTGGYSFWEHIHPLFIARDITRHDLPADSTWACQHTRKLPGAAPSFRDAGRGLQAVHEFPGHPRLWSGVPRVPKRRRRRERAALELAQHPPSAAEREGTGRLRLEVEKDCVLMRSAADTFGCCR